MSRLQLGLRQFLEKFIVVSRRKNFDAGSLIAPILGAICEEVWPR
jgi:hypothetical protein